MAEWISEYRVWLTEEQSMQNAQLVIDYFMSNNTGGWTRESLSAMLGNMRHESSINPNMYEFGYEWSEDRGFGLVQWTPRSKYWDWAISEGYSESELRNGEPQLARIDYEVSNNIQWIARESVFDSLTFEEFRTNSRGLTVAELTEAFTWGYERPNQEAGEESMSERIAFAERVFNELDFSGLGPGTGDCLQLAVLPMRDYLYVTQGEDGEFSHIDSWGIDFVGPTANYPYYAPCNSTCIGRSDSSAILYWMSDKEVMCADGRKRKIIYRCIHDENLLFNVGDKVRKGVLIGHTGNAGQSSGDHLHLDVWLNDGSNVFSFDLEKLHVYEVFSLLDTTQVVETFGYNWIVSNYVDCSGSGENKSQMFIKLLLADTINGWKW